jgi:hypothetical protein
MNVDPMAVPFSLAGGGRKDTVDRTGRRNTGGSSSQRAVVCFVGTTRSLDLTHQNLIQNLIRPLDADVMICHNSPSRNDETMLRYFADCNVVDVCMYEDDKDGFERLFETFSSRLDPKNPSQLRDYLRIEGNWMGGFQARRGSGLYQTYNYWKLAERLEHVRAQGLRYRRFVVTRTDLLWLSEHPPLDLLDPSLVWIPLGEDYGGYNDRHAVCSQRNIMRYLSPFLYMVDSRAREYLRDAADLNHEEFMKRHLSYCGVRVGRFKSTAYITGGRETPTNWKALETMRVDGKTYMFKYASELMRALENSKEFEGHLDHRRMVIRGSPLGGRVRSALLMVKYRWPRLWKVLVRIRPSRP